MAQIPKIIRETVFEVSQGKEFEVSSKRPSFYPFLMLLTQWVQKALPTQRR